MHIHTVPINTAVPADDHSTSHLWKLQMSLCCSTLSHPSCWVLQLGGVNPQSPASIWTCMMGLQSCYIRSSSMMHIICHTLKLPCEFILAQEVLILPVSLEASLGQTLGMRRDLFLAVDTENGHSDQMSLRRAIRTWPPHLRERTVMAF